MNFGIMWTWINLTWSYLINVSGVIKRQQPGNLPALLLPDLHKSRIHFLLLTVQVKFVSKLRWWWRIMFITECRTYWWERSAVYTAPPPLPASSPTPWTGSRTRSAGCCGSSRSRSSGPPAPCRLGRVWRGSPGCRRTWSPSPSGSPVSAEKKDIL